MESEGELHKKFYEVETALRRSFSAVKTDINQIKKNQFNNHKKISLKIEDTEDTLRHLMEDFVTGEQLDAEINYISRSMNEHTEKLEGLKELQKEIKTFHDSIENELSSIRKIHEEVRSFQDDLNMLKKGFVTKEDMQKKIEASVKKAIKKEKINKLRKDVDKLKTKNKSTKRLKKGMVNFFFDRV